MVTHTPLAHTHTELDAKKAASTVSYFNVLCGADPEPDSTQKVVVRQMTVIRLVFEDRYIL